MRNSYEIQISETQRATIAAALRATFGDIPACFNGTPEDEGPTLLDLFDSLPEQAANAEPDTLFDFTL